MGSATDPIYVLVSTHTQSPDGTTRNDTFYMTSSLNAYSTELANNIATPVFNSYVAETKAAGTLSGGGQFVSDRYIGLAAGGPVQLRAEVGIGFEPLATPTRYHLVTQDVFSTPVPSSSALTTNGQWIYNWIDGLLQRLAPVNLYQGVRFL